MANKKILVIDDDLDYIAATTAILEAKGYEVFSASDRKSGLEKISEIVPDLVILDVMMEKMCDGFDIAREIKGEAKYRNMPILMLTAVWEKTGFNFSKVSGDEVWLPVDDYAEKPIKAEDLLAKVEKLLAK